MQAQLIAAVTARLEREPLLRALLLVGSFGRGEADAFSDVDLLAVTPEEQKAALADRWRQVLEDHHRLILWRVSGQDRLLINAVTEDWLRIDLQITDPTRLGRLAKSMARVLIDRDGLADRLPQHLPAGGPDKPKLAWIIEETFRCLGLAPVVIGRGELFTAAGFGFGHLRQLLVSLMLEERALPAAQGALHLSRILTPEQNAVLAALPFPQPERASVIAANKALAQPFIPRAQRLALELGIPWPEVLAAATHRYLVTQLGPDAGW